MKSALPAVLLTVLTSLYCFMPSALADGRDREREHERFSESLSDPGELDHEVDGYLDEEPKSGDSHFSYEGHLKLSPRQSSGSEFQPSWLGQHPDAESWTKLTQEAINAYGSSLLKGARDIRQFCPRYEALSQTHKIDFWVQLIAAMAQYESSYRPDTRYVETTMKNDPVTGQRVVSEGLLQLSYKDELTYQDRIAPGACDFDYKQDRQYSPRDLRRSILNPKINLGCGVAILNHQIASHGKIAISKGAYWAVIKPNSKNHRLPQIKKMTRELEFCR